MKLKFLIIKIEIVKLKYFYFNEKDEIHIKLNINKID